MKFEIRCYSEDGKSLGATILNSLDDVIDGVPVNSLKRASEYASKYLVKYPAYFFVEVL